MVHLRPLLTPILINPIKSFEFLIMASKLWKVSWIQAQRYSVFKDKMRAWRDGSAVKSPGCSSRGSRFQVSALNAS